MAPEPTPEKIKASLHKDHRIISHDDKDSIRIEYDSAASYLEISLRRTIRIPNNDNSYGLPPDCGPFPLYSVNEYKSRLPADIVAKGGCFIPMYQREAMWINFEASRPFAVKVFLGGINAVSGESSNEDMATRLRRNTLLSQGQSVQDYVVPPRQQWLDGVAKSDGRVMQFVAAPMGNGYSVEAQMTGKDSVGGLQFEVIPLKVRTLGNLDNQADPTHLSIKVKNPQGDEMHFKMKPTTTLSKLMDAFCQRENLSGSATKSYHIDAQNHHRIQPTDTCESIGLKHGAVILVRLEQLGGGGPSPVRATEMSLAPGGLIKQTIIKDDIPAGEWDVDSAILVNVQLINAVIFKTITGVTPPKTPISATTYAKHGFPFYETYKEPSGVVGGLRSLKSVGEMDMEKKQNLAGHKAEKNLGFPLVTLAGTKRSFVPVGEMEKTLKKVRVANSL